MPSKVSESDIERLRKAVSLPDSANEADPKELMEKSISSPPERVPSAQRISIKPSIPEKPQKKIIPPQAQENQLFVKIDRHIEVAEQLKELKMDVMSIVDTIALLAKAEKLKAEAINAMDENIDKLEYKLDDIANLMSVPEDMLNKRAYPEKPQIDDNLVDLHSEITSLREQLSSIKS